MKRESALCFASFLALLLLVSTSLVLKEVKASGYQEVEFEVMDHGDISGYFEETYLVVRTEDEWARVWEMHTTPYLPKTPCPEIIFSQKMVICAFMGKRPTTGYSISIERIWTDGERIHVEIAKYFPPKNATVGEALTYPYFFASLERTDLEVVFNITEGSGTIEEFTIPESPTMAFTLTALMVLSAVMFVLMRKTQKNQRLE